MTSLGIDRFGEFFKEVNGYEPYAWQTRLCDFILREQRWPDVIDAPTGSGKSSVVDVFVYTVACMATDPEVQIPRRLALTVNRRALVDNNAEHAEEVVARKLREATDGILKEVADALLDLRRWCTAGTTRGSLDPLVTATLRGGLKPDKDWLDDPAACAVLSATPDMWGSRLLFTGYGSSSGTHPREAGLLAMDSVVVVDEAHLNQQLLTTARQVRRLVSRAGNLGAKRAFQVVEMTATPPKGGEFENEVPTVIGVAPEDLTESSPLTRRLCLPKPVTLVPTEHLPCGKSAAIRNKAAEVLVEQLLELSQTTKGTIACVVNTVELALAVTERLGKTTLPHNAPSERAGTRPSVKTLVGRMRPYDVAKLKTEHKELFGQGGDSKLDIVVATQTIEVGLDMDFSAMVTELAPGSSLAQRAGRVNRSGTRSSAPIRVVTPAEPLSEKSRESALYSWEELEQSRLWAMSRAETSEGLAAWALHPAGGGAVPPPAQPRRPVFHRPEPWNVDLWSRTGQRLFAPISLDLWLQDGLDAEDTAGVAIRAGLPGDASVLAQQFEQAPILDHEVFPTSVRLLSGIVQDKVEPLLDEPGGPRAFLLRNGEYQLLSEVLASTRNSSAWLYPGDIVILDTSVQMFREGVPSLEGNSRVDDVSELDLPSSAPEEFKRRAVRISIGSALLSELVREREDPLLDDLRKLSLNPGFSEEELETEFRIRLLEALGRSGDSSPRIQLLKELLGSPEGEALPEVTFRAAPQSPTAEDFWLVVSGAGLSDAIEEIRQEWTPGGVAVHLSAHQDAVSKSAANLSSSLRLPQTLGAVLEQAGRLHDEGKRDSRFQAALRARDGDHAGEVLAKSGMKNRGLARRRRAASGLPGGWRHEQLSAVEAWRSMAEGDPSARDLVTRLAGTSHGHGRALFNFSSTELLEASAEEVLRRSAQELYDGGEWDLLMERTNERHGVWGMAYLEALLRAADVSVSKRGS